MPGSPLGVVYTLNPRVLAGLGLVIEFSQVPTFIQIAVAKLLEDKGKEDSYFHLFKNM